MTYRGWTITVKEESGDNHGHGRYSATTRSPAPEPVTRSVAVTSGAKPGVVAEAKREIDRRIKRAEQ